MILSFRDIGSRHGILHLQFNQNKSKFQAKQNPAKQAEKIGIFDGNTFTASCLAKNRKSRCRFCHYG